MHFIVAACFLQLRGYFLTTYYLIELKRHLQITQLSLQLKYTQIFFKV